MTGSKLVVTSSLSLSIIS